MATLLDVFLNISDNPPPPKRGGKFVSISEIDIGKPLFYFDSGLYNYPNGVPFHTLYGQLKIYNVEGLDILSFDKSIEEIKKAGLESLYTEHALAIYPTDSNGVPFTVTYFASTGDPLADISEDMAAEQKARATYENLIDLTDDPDLLAPLSLDISITTTPLSTSSGSVIPY